MYQILEYSRNLDFEQIAMELNVDYDYVEKYFEFYRIVYTMPIKSLSYQEKLFVAAIKYIQTLSMDEIKLLLDAHNISEDDLNRDPLLLERKVSGYLDETSYSKTIKYSKFGIECALMFDNSESPQLAQLTYDEQTIILTNIALGRSLGKHGAKPSDRIAAIDMLNKRPIPVLEYTPSDDIDNLSIEEMRKIVNIKEKNKLGEPMTLVDIIEEKRNKINEQGIITAELEDTRLEDVNDVRGVKGIKKIKPAKGKN